MTDIEENILAAALLWWLSEEEETPPLMAMVPELVRATVYDRFGALDPPADLAVLVADCERRAEVEACEREVLGAADIWGSRWAPDVDFRVAHQWLEDAVRHLRAAREAL